MFVVVVCVVGERFNFRILYVIPTSASLKAVAVENPSPSSVIHNHAGNDHVCDIFAMGIGAMPMIPSEHRDLKL